MKGSHHIFTREGIAEILNLQPKKGGKAKAYQVAQVRDVVVDYGLALKIVDGNGKAENGEPQ